MNKMKQEYRIGTGATSMLMIFIALCLTTLAILAITSARTDLSMTGRNEEMILGYYEAASEAQEILSRLDGEIAKVRGAATDENSYLEKIASVKLDGVELTHPEERLIAFALNAGHGGVLQVAVEATPFGDAGRRYVMRRHVLIADGEWEPDADHELFYDENAALEQGSAESDDEDGQTDD